MNVVTVNGNLTHDPVLSYTPSGIPYSKVQIGSNRKYRKQNGDRVDEANFFEIEVWGKSAENMVKFLEKGRGIFITGRLRQSRWKDGEVNRQKVYIVAEYIEYQ